MGAVTLRKGDPWGGSVTLAWVYSVAPSVANLPPPGGSWDRFVFNEVQKGWNNGNIQSSVNDLLALRGEDGRIIIRTVSNGGTNSVFDPDTNQVRGETTIYIQGVVTENLGGLAIAVLIAVLGLVIATTVDILFDLNVVNTAVNIGSSTGSAIGDVATGFLGGVLKSFAIPIVVVLVGGVGLFYVLRVAK